MILTLFTLIKKQQFNRNLEKTHTCMFDEGRGASTTIIYKVLECANYL